MPPRDPDLFYPPRMRPIIAYNVADKVLQDRSKTLVFEVRFRYNALRIAFEIHGIPGEAIIRDEMDGDSLTAWLDDPNSHHWGS